MVAHSADEIKSEIKASYSEEELVEIGKFIGPYFSEVKKKAVRWVMLNERKRLDGRAFDEIRPIWAEVDYLPNVHGSAVFTRGETQSLTTLTLGGKMDEQLIDGDNVENVGNPANNNDAAPVGNVGDHTNNNDPPVVVDEQTNNAAAPNHNIADSNDQGNNDDTAPVCNTGNSMDNNVTTSHRPNPVVWNR